MDKLSDEILCMIIDSLNHEDLLKLSKTCKSFHNIISDEKIWRKLIARDYPDFKDQKYITKATAKIISISLYMNPLVLGIVPAPAESSF